MARRLAVVLVAGLVAGLSGGAARADASQPLVGGDYYGTDCEYLSELIRDAVDPALEREQMFAMHASGLNSLAEGKSFTSDRSLIYGGHGGAIPIQPDGTLGEPYRSRFIRYLTDARDAGFADVTIRFYPYGPNSPFPWTQGVYGDLWDPSLYPADWRFVQDVHDLTKQYGPPESHFDLMAEGPPNDYERGETGYRIDDFIKRLYSDYVDKYGNGDVFFSVVGEDPAPLVNLIVDLEQTGRPLPHWWGSDIGAEYGGGGAAADFAISETQLNRFGVSGSLALEETAYESADVAAAVQSFNTTSNHQVVQVEEYPNLGTPDCVPAPYTGDVYLKVLGIEPGPLQASIDSKGRPKLTTSDGVPITALKARQYTIVVTDNSKKAGFRLAGPGVTRHTTPAFRGKVTWRVDLSAAGYYGTFHGSGGAGKRPVTFILLP